MYRVRSRVQLPANQTICMHSRERPTQLCHHGAATLKTVLAARQHFARSEDSHMVEQEAAASKARQRRHTRIRPSLCTAA